MADDRTRLDSDHQYTVKMAQVAQGQYWMICPCENCRVTRGLFTDLVKSAVLDALAENEIPPIPEDDGTVSLVYDKKDFYG